MVTEGTALRGLQPVEKPMPEPQVRSKEQQKQSDGYTPTAVSSPPSPPLRRPTVTCGEGTEDQREGSRRGQREAEACFSECFFVFVSRYQNW